MEYLNDRFCASGFYTKIRHSTDNGSTFTTNQSDSQRIAGFAYGNGLYFSAGRDQDNSDADSNLLSTDGENWHLLTTTNQPDRNAAIFFNNTFLTVGDAGNIWQSDPVAAVSGWSLWQTAQFPGLPANSGAYEDYDLDGVANLLEYISGTDPKDTSAFSRPVLTEESGYMTLTLNKAAGVSGFTLIIEASDDLTLWDTTDTTIVTDDASMLKVRLNLLPSDPTQPRMFMRANATLTP